MKITSQDPLVYFAAEAKSLGENFPIILPEGEKQAFLDYYSALFGVSRAMVYDARDLVEETLLPEGDPLLITKGTPMDVVLSFLKLTGYTRVDFCYDSFQWAKRGFVLDIYSDELYRLDFDEEDRVESIRIVDSETQMSIRRTEYATLWTRQIPVRPIDRMTQAVIYDSERTYRELRAVEVELTFPIRKVSPVKIDKFISVPSFSIDDLTAYKGKMVLVTQFPEVFSRKLGWPVFDSISAGLTSGEKRFLVHGRIRMPFSLDGFDIHIDREGLGWKVGHRRSLELSWHGLKIGEPVLHVDRGVGVYDGIEYVEGKPYFSISYKDGHVLVPLERSQKLVRVPSTMSIDSLGPARWSRKSRALQQRALKMRSFLENRFKQKKSIQSFTIEPDEEIESAFAQSFQFEETSDQKQATEELHAWLAIPHPEEALIIGESGVGKTEVLMRAAVAVASAGYKAVIVVPTRVLVDQYMAAYSERIQSCGLLLSDDPALPWDILVGTHSLLKKELYDDKLALVIFDEEQKFGVTHKNWFQEHFPWVKVIFSSATPIPRTFFLARRGYVKLIRMHELPYGRQKVTVFADEYSPDLVRKVLSDELDRGGLVIYIHPTIEGIDLRALELQQMFLDAEIEVLHARMTDKRIKSIFKKLQEGKIDILVATTIMEAGVDLPIANTIVVEDATHLGVSQMYQLKGRVGRNSVKGYAWFLYPPTASPATRSRIHSTVKLLNYSDSYALAELDTRYRGIGEIFGIRQHGLVKQEDVFAVDALLEQTYREEETEIVSWPIKMNIPEWILPEPERSNLLKDILDADTERELMQLFLMFKDLVGHIPEESKALFAYSLLKVLGNKRGITMIKFNSRGFQLVRENEIQDFKTGSVSSWDAIFAAVECLGGAKEWFEILKA